MCCGGFVAQIFEPVESIAETVADVAESAAGAVENVIENPLPVIETIALTAAGVPAPIASAAVAAANGGDVEDVAKAAAGSYAGGQVGGAVGSAVPAEVSQIASSAASGATQAAVTGRDIGTGALTGAVGGAAGAVTPQVADVLGVSPNIAGAITRAAGAGTSAALTGGDVGAAIGRSAALSGIGEAGQAINRAVTTPELVRPGIEEQTPAQVAEQMGPEAYALAYPDRAPIDMTPYEGLGYTEEDVRQLQRGTYAGRELTEEQAREQLGNLYDITYPEGFPTSSSAYEGLGYTAQDIYELGEGTYAGPEQTPEQVREQMGDQYDLAYGDVYREPEDISGAVRQAAAPFVGYTTPPEQRVQQGGYQTIQEGPTSTPTSTAYLARGAVGSPEITGSPVFGTEKGKRKKVWNIESLREALGV